MSGPSCILEFSWKTGNLWDVSVPTWSMFVHSNKWFAILDQVHDFAILLCWLGIDLEHEDAAAVYLCVRIEQNDSCLQEGLIDHVFEALEFDVDTVNKKAASSETKALVKVYMEKLHMMTEASVCFTIILCTNDQILQKLLFVLTWKGLEYIWRPHVQGGSF